MACCICPRCCDRSCRTTGLQTVVSQVRPEAHLTSPSRLHKPKFSHQLCANHSGTHIIADCRSDSAVNMQVQNAEQQAHWATLCRTTCKSRSKLHSFCKGSSVMTPFLVSLSLSATAAVRNLHCLLGPHPAAPLASEAPAQGINRAQLVQKMVIMHLTVSQKKVG